MLASDIALKIVQTAIKSLLSPEQAKIVESWQIDSSGNQQQITRAIARAKELLNWSDNSEITALRVIFDQIDLGKQQEEKNHYWQPRAIANQKPSIPYPQTSKEDKSQYLQDFSEEIAPILSERDNWQNLSLLTLIIEKYGSFISLGQENIAFVDLVRSTAAIAAALAENPKAEKLSLIVGDLSGVQKFIYTISSAGALKSLRARSFYLELVTEEIVQQLLEKLKLPRTNIIFAGASKLYILAADADETKEAVTEIGSKFNKWLKKEFQGKVFLALDSYKFEVAKVSSQEFAYVWSKANKNLDQMRSQKFRHQISDLLNPKDAHEPCKVCHRDDTENLEYAVKGDPSTPLSCDTCRQLYTLGEKLFKVDAVVRSSYESDAKKNSFGILQVLNVTYHLFRNYKNINVNNDETLSLVNDFNLEHYSRKEIETNLLLLGNYSQTVQDETITRLRSITASELAEASQGIKRVGYLRMDVDNLGKIFAEGLKEKQTLPQIAGLSRQMTYFFKVYLNSLAERRNQDFLEKKETIEILENIKSFSQSDRPNLLFIYAGGDDLFISGAWNEIVEFSFDVYQSFRAYTGYNPDITISAGIELAVAKYPLYQAADDSGDAEETAKGNGRDNLTLFGETFKWDEWLGSKNLSIETVEAKDKEYWDNIHPTNKADKPNLLGIFPIVERLSSKKIGQEYTRNFVRNLIKASNLQRQKIKEIEEGRKTANYDNEVKDIKYYLHLPQIAYTLARLPTEMLKDEDFRKALKNPYNATYYRAIATWLELLNRESK